MNDGAKLDPKQQAEAGMLVFRGIVCETAHDVRKCLDLVKDEKDAAELLAATSKTSVGEGGARDYLLAHVHGVKEKGEQDRLRALFTVKPVQAPPAPGVVTTGTPAAPGGEPPPRATG